MNQEAFDRLTGALKRTIPHPIGLIEDSGKPRQVGQYYLTIPEPTFPSDLPKECKTDDPVSVVIISSHSMPLKEHTLHLVAPVINTIMAGPEDIILPREILPYRPAIAIGTCFSVLDQSLGKCMGRLPDETTNDILNFREFIHDNIDTCPKVITGPDYLDEMDIRYKFHQTILDQVAYLTVPVLHYITQIWGPKLDLELDELEKEVEGDDDPTKESNQVQQPDLTSDNKFFQNEIDNTWNSKDEAGNPVNKKETIITCTHCNSNNCEPLEGNEWECYDCGETFTPKDSKKIA